VATRWSPVQWGAPGARGPLSRRLGYRAPALGRRPRRLIATRGGHNRERSSSIPPEKRVGTGEFADATN